MLIVIRFLLAAIAGWLAGKMITVFLHKNGKQMDRGTESTIAEIGLIAAAAFYTVIPFILSIFENVIRTFSKSYSLELDELYTFSLPFRIVLTVVGTAAVLAWFTKKGLDAYSKQKRNELKRRAQQAEQKEKENAQKQELIAAKRYLDDPAWMEQLDERVLASIPRRTSTMPGYALRFCLDGVYTKGLMPVQKDGKEQVEEFQHLCMTYPFKVTANETLLAAAHAYGEYIRRIGRNYKKFELWDQVVDTGDRRYVYYSVQP